MQKRLIRGVVLVAAGLALILGGAAHASDPGPHGCVLGDVNGTAVPIVYGPSDTSQIGGNSCTYLQLPGADGGAGGYVAAAQSWSIDSCVPVSPTVCNPDPAHSYSSAAGSLNVGMTSAIPAGDEVTATVSNGVLIAGTPDGA